MEMAMAANHTDDRLKLARPKARWINPTILVCTLLLFFGVSASAYKDTAKVTPAAAKTGTATVTQGNSPIAPPSMPSPPPKPEQSSTNTAMTKTTKDSQPTPTYSSSNKPYVPPKCTTEIYPYKTFYKYAPYLGGGLSNVSGGYTGSKQTCSADSNGYKPQDVVLQPIDKTIYIGDGGVSLQMNPIRTPDSYETIYARISGPGSCGLILTNTGDSTAYKMCTDMIMWYFGYGTKPAIP